MTISAYALKKRANLLRSRLADFGFETEEDLLRQFEDRARNPLNKISKVPIERRAAEVVWLEARIDAAEKSQANHEMRKAEWDKANVATQAERQGHR